MTEEQIKQGRELLHQMACYRFRILCMKWLRDCKGFKLIGDDNEEMAMTMSADVARPLLDELIEGGQQTIAKLEEQLNQL